MNLNRTIVLLFLLMTFSTLSAQTVRVTAIGDIMAHLELQKFAQSQPDGYKCLFADVQQYFNNDDLTIANLEVPVCDSRPISGYPRFNAHSELTEAVKKAGIELVSLANNHAFDQTADGVRGTLDAVNRAGIMHNGTGLTPNEARQPLFFDVNGVKIAFLSVTFSVNYIKMPEEDDKPFVHIIDMTGKEHSASEMAFLRLVKETKQKCDAVIVALHFGEEYTYRPSDKDTEYLFMLAEWGADVILGGHPHVLHKAITHQTKDGRDVLIFKSLGNFISAQARYFSIKSKPLTFDNLKDCVEIRTAESIIAKFDIIKDGNSIIVKNESMIPIFNVRFPIDNDDISFGFRLLEMPTVFDKNFDDKRITEMEHFDLLKKLVRFRYFHLPGITELV
ncbi:MAG: CapA family protein [Spirochaetales bacterium]|nr:CapA family protein [Spirochaetales bacterium]